MKGSENGFLLAFWVCWMAAEYCVFFRLKTPLGKASDTFQAIEGNFMFYFVQNNQSFLNLIKM